MRELKVDLLFLPPYSPFMAPIEQLFGHLKRTLRRRERPPLRAEFTKVLQAEIAALNSSQHVGKLWVYSVRAW